MTYIGSYDNGQIAVNTADKRSSLLLPSGSKRESDNTYKISEFQAKYAHGVVLSTGSILRGNLVNYFISQVTKSTETKSLDDLVKSIFEFHGNKFEAYKQQLIEAVDSETQQVAATIENDGKEIKASFIRITSLDPNSDDYKKKLSEIENRIVGNVENYLEERRREKINAIKETKNAWETTILITAYDKQQKRIRNFAINDSRNLEMAIDSTELGSGQDLANAYMDKVTQGLPKKKDMKLADLVYCSVGSYVAATQNSGVGGDPVVSVTGEDGVKELEGDRSRVLANLLGMVEAEGLTKTEVYPLVKELVIDWEQGKSTENFLKRHKSKPYIAEWGPLLPRVTLQLGQWMTIVNEGFLNQKKN